MHVNTMLGKLLKSKITAKPTSDTCARKILINYDIWVELRNANIIITKFPLAMSTQNFNITTFNHFDFKKEYNNAYAIWSLATKAK